MKELGDEERHTISELARLEKWWQVTMDQQSYINGTESHHYNVCWLDKQTWNTYKSKRADYIELQLEVTQHHARRLQNQGIMEQHCAGLLDKRGGVRNIGKLAAVGSATDMPA